MLGIFDDKRRGSRPKAPDPPINSYGGTEPFCAQLQDMAAASRLSCVGPATRRQPLLPLAKNGSRHGYSLNVYRP